MIEFKFENLPQFNLDWWEPTQKAWAPVLLEDHKIAWRAQREPTLNKPWAALTDAYAKVKARKWPGKPILRASGEMQDTVRIYRDGAGFSVETAFYGIFHQFGTSKMVARPWLGVPEISLQRLTEIALKNILSEG